MVSLESVRLVCGIFGTFAFVLVGVMLKRYQLEQGPWLILSLVVLCFTLGEMHPSDWFPTVGMILLALLALVKFYDIMRLTQ